MGVKHTMSPEKARVFVAEDDPDHQDTIRERLERDGHSVVLSARTRNEALSAVNKLKELKVQVATIDGNLSPWEESGQDGKDLIAAIRKVAPDVVTIDMSLSGGLNADITVGKGNARTLSKVITDL